jgi:hypothetical protein
VLVTAQIENRKSHCNSNPPPFDFQRADKIRKARRAEQSHMSDITLNFSPLELVLIAIVVGLPGALAGLLVGAILLRRRPALGALAGAALGDAGWTAMLLPWG